MATSAAWNNNRYPFSRCSTPPSPLSVKPIRPPPVAPSVILNLEVACIAYLQENVRSATYNGLNLYSTDARGVINVWNTGVGTYTKFSNGFNVPINVLQGTREGKDMWLGFSNGDIAIMSIESTIIGFRWRAHPGGVSCIVAGTNSVWSGGVDFTIRKWGLDGQTLSSYSYHHSAIRWVLMVKEFPDKSAVQLWSSSDTTIAVALLLDDVEHHEMVSNVHILSGHARIVSVLCQVGSDTVWSGSEDNTIRVWSCFDMSCMHVLSGHRGSICSMVELGIHVWSGSTDQTILVWDATTYQLLYSLGDHGGYVRVMVKVDWHLWAFASGKNVKIWAAASVWSLARRENERLRDVIEAIHMEKNAVQNASEGNQVAIPSRTLKVDSARSDLRSQKEEILKLQEEVVKIHNIKDNLMCELVDLENRKKDMENGHTWHTKDAVGLQQPLSHDAETNEKSISFASQYTQVSEDIELVDFVKEDIEKADLLKEVFKLQLQLQESIFAAEQREELAAQELAQLNMKMQRGRGLVTEATNHELVNIMEHIDREKATGWALGDENSVAQELIKLRQQIAKEREAAKSALEEIQRPGKGDDRRSEDVKTQIEGAVQASVDQKLANLERRLKVSEKQTRETQIELELAQVDVQETLEELQASHEELQKTKYRIGPKHESMDTVTNKRAEKFITSVRFVDGEKGRLREALEGMTKAVEFAASTALAASYNYKLSGTSF
ncbi:hypothetical protein BDL97_13G079800 [Sphagnum fallax]|nr:hypothetical protein BDL97_13G079800 [Sphagnum fallax]